MAPPIRRAALACAAVTALASAVLWGVRPSRPPSLWQGAGYTRADRDRAIQRGLVFMYSQARDPKTFLAWGHDLIGAFASIAATSRDPQLRRMAWTMGRERAAEWRRLHPSVPPGTDPTELTTLLMGSEAAERLGLPDPVLRRQIREAAARFTAVNYYGFDPALEAPPADLPEPHCGLVAPRGAGACPRCGRPLTMRTRYDAWMDVLISTYTGDRYGVTLGANYPDALHWLPAMRPYPRRGGSNYQDYIDAVYAVTHLVYTLDDYSVNRLDPACLPDEFAYLKENMRNAIEMKDPETMGEYLDTLQAFGLGLEAPLIRTGIDYLIAVQNPDGSWGDLADSDPYNRYHPTWTAVDGLREYRWSRTLPCVAP